MSKVVYLFGYGSLLTTELQPQADDAVPAVLHGWRRGWDVAMDNTRDLPGYKHYLDVFGRRPALRVAFLDIRPRAGGEVNGVAFPVSLPELRVADNRERNYHRVDVSPCLGREFDGPVWAYVGRSEARRRRDEGAALGSLAVARSYYEGVRGGFALLGQDALEEFHRSTDPLPCALADLRVVHHA